MAFRGWKVEALEFYEALEANNSKSFWDAHKDVYRDVVRAPMEELLADLEPTMGEGRIFRPYRDVRFSKDKSPYKTAIGATIGKGYIHLDARGLAAGAGMWEMAPDQLDRYRAAVDGKTGAQLERIIAEARTRGLDVMSRAELKTAPQGYPKDHPRVELLRRKGLATWREWPAGAWLGTRKAEDRLVEFFERSKPLVAWLRKNVGDSELPSHRR
jgi:uncharacterized protein (TIGR02453 family)